MYGGMTHEALFQVSLGVLGLDILLAILYLRKHRRLIDPFSD